MFRKELIIFYYFPFKNVYYTPLDLGYIMAIMKQKGMKKYKIKMFPHPLSFYESEKEIEANINKEISLILDKKPKAIFFFLDNINWSSIYAFGRAKKIAYKLRKNNSQLFIGVQSYKFHQEHIKKNSLSKIFDCLIFGSPEKLFILLDEIINKKQIDGVIYDNEKGSEEKCQRFYEKNEKNIIFKNNNLDYIPSPYLERIFDKYLLNQQNNNKKKFTAFIYSSRGCSFGCYYCPRSIKYEKVRFFSVKRFYDEIEYIYNKFQISRFFVLDDAFAFSEKRLSELHIEFEKRKSRNNLDKIKLFINARPEQLNDINFDLISKLNVTWVQIGLQTINPALQGYMNRRVELEKFKNISKLSKQYGINLFIDVIVGLPHDSIGFFKKTIDFAISLSPKTIQAKQLYHSPYTRFFLEEEKYEIITENIDKDFILPYVSESAGLDKNYYDESFHYLIKKAKNNDAIAWKIIVQNGIYLNKKMNFIF